MKFNVGLALAITSGLFIFGGANLIQSNVNKPASASQVYDISQWQGRLSNYKVRQLKREVPFVIVRAQNGGLYQDTQFRHNAYLMRKNHLPYGVYNYSLARTPRQAEGEAYSLVRRAPRAKFYVDDVESTNGNPNIARSARAWARTIHRYSRRPAILYSYSSFLNSNLRSAINSFNGVWLAQYSDYEPSENYHYDLWQFTDNHFSRALRENLDDSTFPRNSRSLSFWIGGRNGHMRMTNHITGHHHYLRRHHAHKHHKHSKYYYDDNNLSPYINTGYYSSPSDNRFRVIANKGVELYSIKSGRPIHRLAKGQTITRGSYQLYYHKYNGLTTRGVGIWHGHKVAYTMDRSMMQSY